LRHADAMNDRACDADARRCVNCNAVSPMTTNDPINIVPGVEAERPPWGRRTLCGGSVPLVAMLSMMTTNRAAPGGAR
jgi:hypothetical protein